MHLELCIGLLESRDGPYLGLRDLVETQVRPRHPGITANYHSYHDYVVSSINRTHGPGGAGRRPLILLGHSYGASALVRAAERIPSITIDHLILLDPVPRWLWGQFQWSCWHLPRNVKAATCIYNPWSLPKSSPIRGGFEQFRNIEVSPLHASIPGDPEVQGYILEIIERECATSPATPPPPKEVKVPPVVRVGL